MAAVADQYKPRLVETVTDHRRERSTPLPSKVRRGGICTASYMCTEAHPCIMNTLKHTSAGGALYVKHSLYNFQ